MVLEGGHGDFQMGLRSSLVDTSFHIGGCELGAMLTSVIYQNIRIKTHHKLLLSFAESQLKTNIYSKGYED